MMSPSQAMRGVRATEGSQSRSLLGARVCHQVNTAKTARLAWIRPLAKEGARCMSHRHAVAKLRTRPSLSASGPGPSNHNAAPLQPIASKVIKKPIKRVNRAMATFCPQGAGGE